MRRQYLAAIQVMVSIIFSGGVWAQTWPNRPVRIITSGIGGSADIVARVIAQGITPPPGTTSRG